MSRDPRLRNVAAALLLAALALYPVPATAADDATPVDVTDAVLRWGMSNEANNAAHAPGTYNFFSAGKIPDPGKANVVLPQTAWAQSSGPVAIEKWNGTAYRPATWAGLSTDSDGVTIPGPSSGRYSGHQFVFSGGTGTVDRAAGTAQISWDGDVSVLAYSGYTFFYLSDPVLEVADGAGTLTGTLSGFGSSREQPDLWQEIAPVEVTLADLPAVDLDDGAGFNAVPAYDGVEVVVGGTPYTGAFPQSFLDFQHQLGTAPFWLNSGSSTDPAKKAQALTVSYDASDPVTPTEPEEQTPAEPIDNDAPERPADVVRTITRTVTRTLAAAPVVASTPVAAAPLTTSPVVQLVSVPARTESSDAALGWWLGGAFLALAALVVAGSLIFTSPTP